MGPGFVSPPEPAHRQSLLVAVLRGVAVAVAAGFAVIMVVGSTASRIEPAWLGESAEAGLVAAVWMIAGLRAARAHRFVPGIVIYTFGTVAAWFLARGIVHSTSVYYGLVPIAAACAGGTIAWLAMLRGSGMRPAPAMRHQHAIALAYAIALPFLVLAAILWNAPLGHLRGVTAPGSEAMRLPLHMADPRGDAWYVWSPEDVDLATIGGSPVYIETDPGSGSSAFAVVPVSSRDDIVRACASFRADIASVVAHDIARGDVPALVTRMPTRYPSCERGRVWIARRAALVMTTREKTADPESRASPAIASWPGIVLPHAPVAPPGAAGPDGHPSRWRRRSPSVASV